MDKNVANVASQAENPENYRDENIVQGIDLI
jgi:hypothetical protein